VRKTIALLSAALLAAFVVAGVRLAHAGREQAAKACPSGYMTQGEIEAAAQRAGAGEAGELSGGSLDSVCVSAKHPEKLLELIQRQEEQKTVRSAPYSSVAPGAYANAVNQHQNLGKNGPRKSCSKIESLGLGLERNRAVTRAFSPRHKPWRKSSPTAWRCSQDSNRK